MADEQTKPKRRTKRIARMGPAFGVRLPKQTHHDFIALASRKQTTVNALVGRAVQLLLLIEGDSDSSQQKPPSAA